jgi:predicted RNase H-like HicB family nuclease
MESMTYKSTAIINKEGKWFVAHSAELGVVSQGKTVEEARKNLEEAVELYLEDMPHNKKVLNKNHPIITSIEVNA